MTLIATFRIDGCPVMLGDLLVSGLELSDSPLNTPTAGDIARIFPKGSGFVPTGLRQKLAVINDNLAVAWSGTRISAQTIIAQLREECQKRKHWSLQDLPSLFSHVDNADGSKVAILGTCYDGEGIFSFGYGGLEQMKFQSDKYGLVRLSGTGASDMNKYLELFPLLTASRTTNPLETAVGNALAIINHMTGLEGTTSGSLLQYYGGGFEILSFVRKKLVKIDDIIYLIWVGRQKNDETWEVSPPERCIKYSYASDMLMIRKVEFKPRANGSLRSEDETIYLVPPIYRNVNETDVRDIRMPSLNSTFLCSFVILHGINDSGTILNRIDYSSQNTHKVRFTEKESHIFLNIHSDFIESITRGINLQMDSSEH